MRKVLITGGAGYIGAATAQLFLKKNFLVFAVDDLSTGKNLLAHKNYLFIKSDYSSNHILNLLKKEKIQDVIHLAASIDNNVFCYKKNSVLEMSLRMRMNMKMRVIVILQQLDQDILL